MKIQLADLIQYYDQEDDKIQIVFSGHEWDDSYEMFVNSELLKPYTGYTITDMRIERSCTGDPVIRVAIKKGDYYDRLEAETHKQEVLGGCGAVCYWNDYCVRRHTGNSRTGYGTDYVRGGCDCIHHWGRVS